MLYSKLASMAALLVPVAVAQDPYAECTARVTRASRPPQTRDDIPAALTALHDIKTSIGPDGLINLLQPSIEAAYDSWHDVIDSATEEYSGVSADGHAALFIPGLTAASFALSSQSELADEADHDANPEHYVNRTTPVSLGVQSSEILEGRGGVITYFTVPTYSNPPDDDTCPFLSHPDFPDLLSAAGPKNLNDGTNTTFGVLFISVRDTLGAAYPGWGLSAILPGAEIWSTVYYGDTLPEGNIQAESEHMINETINITIQAAKDTDILFNAPKTC
ncbi:hypothetical protein F4778DRAFT_789410 [Xylariomycetidae sp. FL2044]|nr:hypothetical protein F4778DRAFT_789410 [Xylariomycetidae sp. FL2044]